MVNDSETVREVCAEMKDESASHHRDYFDNREIGLLADRILAAHEREMAAKEAVINRLSDQSAFAALHKCPFPSYRCNGTCSSLMLEKIERQTAEIEKLRTALKPILACNEESCRAFGDHYIMLDDAVREAQRVMRKGGEK